MRAGNAAEAQDALAIAFDALDDVQSPMTESDVLLYAAWSYLDTGDVAHGLDFGQAAWIRHTTARTWTVCVTGTLVSVLATCKRRM